MNVISSETTSKRVPRVQKADDRSPLDAFELYKAPEGDNRPIVIIRPPYLLSKMTYTAPITLPIGAGYVAAVLEKAGYNVSIIDALGDAILQMYETECGQFNVQGLTTEEILGRIPDDTAIVGVSLMFSQEWVAQRTLIEKIKERFPDITVIVGGEHPTAMPEFVLRDCPEVDFIVTGEGELGCLELVHRLATEAQLDGIQGVHFLNEDGELVSGGLSRRIGVIDEMPRPAWHLINVENYFMPNWTQGLATGRNVAVIATRGCPYQCSFCSNPFMWTTRYIARDVVDVVDEIEELIDRYQATSIDFYDLTAIVKKEWIMDFCNEVKRRKLKFIWQLPSGTRSEALDDETLQAIFDTGCGLLTYAPESGSPESLKVVKKNVKLPRIQKSIRSAVKIGHTVKLNLIIGFPHERHRNVMETVFFAWKMGFVGPEDLNISIFTPYPGSEIYDQLREEGIIGELSDDYFNSLLVQGSLTGAFSVSKHVSSRFMGLARLFGIGGFYAIAYLTHPSRIWRILKNLMAPQFQAHNLLEQRISDFRVRSKAQKAK